MVSLGFTKNITITVNRNITLYMQQDIKTMDVFSEEFLTLFHDVLEKFVTDFDDMSQMKAIKQAQELLNTINQG